MKTEQAIENKEAAIRSGSANVRVFDWDKAATIIRERGAKDAGAGLSGDWEWTGGSILKDGKPDMEPYTFLASLWATPELEIGDETIACWRYASECGWDSGTKWPESALAILNSPQP